MTEQAPGPGPVDDDPPPDDPPHDAGSLDLLAFGPHPDDVELFCGGLLAAAAARGQRTGVVDLTRGEMSTRGTPEVRAAEAAAAGQALGVAHRENLQLPDGLLDPASGLHLPGPERARSAPLARVVEVIRRLRPAVVLAPWEEARHPDHEAASALVTRAVFFAGVGRWETEPARPPFSPRQLLYYPQRRLAAPSFVTDVSAVYDDKVAAIRCYASQVGEQPDAPFTLVGSPLSLSSLEARDRFYGAQIGVAHGEPYLSRETVPLDDPVTHFTRGRAQPALFFPERR